ncbi:unnamed protein product, partial [Staurois parvus]
MALGRKGLTSGVIKGLTVCCVCFNACVVCVLLCKHATVYFCSVLCREVHSNMLLLAGERPVLFTHR